MSICFTCDKKLSGERTKVCSRTTPHSNVPFIEKIAEVAGDEILDIVTPADYICKKCTSILTRVDKYDTHLKLIKNEVVSKLLKSQQQKVPLYICQICTKSFDSRIDCLNHIQKDHIQLTPSTSNTEKEIEYPRPVTSKVMKPEPPKTQENNQQAESPMDVGKNPQDKNKGTVDIDMMLNDYVPTEVSGDFEQEEETENSQEDKTSNEAKLEIQPEPVQKAVEEEVEDTAVLGQEEADQETPDSVKIEFDEDNKNVENKTGLLDMESLLAAIHNDNPTNN